MSLINVPYTFTVGAVIVASQHNLCFSIIYQDYNGNITTANIASNAGILDTQLASITTAGKVSGAALTNLSGVPSGAGVLPTANGGIPSGCILMWSGTIATIPSGFYLCNGSNGTPDLRNRFIVAANTDDSGVAKSTITGSALQTSEGQLPAHTHTAELWHNSGVDRHQFSGSYNDADAGYTATTNSTGTGTANVARFYALAYIMRA